MSITRIAGAALNQVPLDWSGNQHRILTAIKKAQSLNVELLCLPELAITGYGCEDLFLSDWLYEKAGGVLLEITKACHRMVVVIGLPLKHRGVRYNAVCLVRDGRIEGFYVKQHLALDGVHYEPRWFTPWKAGVIEKYRLGNASYDIGDIIYDYQGIKIAFEICEDAWRDHRPARRLARDTVKLIMNPSASHFAFGKTLLREKLVADSSNDFNCTYLYANLLGNEAGRMIYDGELLIAQNGKILNRNRWLSFNDVDLIYHDVDIRNPAQTPAREVPRYDRSKNNEFTRAASLALFDYLRKSGSRGFTLSLSGGADSSTIAVLVGQMVTIGIRELGIEAFVAKTRIDLEVLSGMSPEEHIRSITGQLLTCAYQSTKNSSESTRHAAAALALELGADFHCWTIDDEVGSYTRKAEKAVGRSLNWEKDDLALQNIQARSRSPIIWMIANLKKQLLLTTSNRSEGDVGYATMDGDTSGSISPIAAVDKYFIIEWLKWAEKELGYKALRYVNSLAPSAELRPPASTQTDEADLMPYRVMVAIERLAVRDHRSPKQVFETLRDRELEDAGLLKAHIKKFYTLWARNQWKRERIAPSFHLDDFNVDPRTWCRFPILSKGFEEELNELE